MGRARRAGAVFALLACAGSGPAPRPANAAEAPVPTPERARALHRDALVVDGHNDVPTLLLDHGFDLGMDGAGPRTRSYWPWFFFPWLPFAPHGASLRTDTDLARIERGGLDACFYSIWVPPGYVDPERPGLAAGRALELIEAMREQARRHADRMELVDSAAGVRRAAAAGRHAALLGVEGGHAIEGDLATLRRFRALGVRYMTLTWSFSHAWADSSGDAPRHGGLTPFGREVVREMNRLGILVDVSHASDETFWDALETSRAPVIASHSSARALAPHPRNLSDPMLRAVAASGGVVMVNFGGIFLDPRKVGTWNHVRNRVRHGLRMPTTVAMLADHVEHVAAVAGVEHVGLGSDFDGTLFLPEELDDVDELPALTVELARRGWSEADLRRVLGENALRVLEAAEAHARGAPSAGGGASPGW